eukprot:TRINITY_DN97_c0_g1_i2.p1 TRINITY_DN97_c0_g1~~TRINITY_DN97_c0_g1_i2.p1  ORF type:complete len:720 (+),score=163.87 TRINITY_DN97_c0_g1_i2:216-2375(+)
MANFSIDQMSATLFSEASDVSETTFLMEILEPLSAELGMFCFAVFIYAVFTGSTFLGSSRAKNAALKAKISKLSSPPVSGSKKVSSSPVSGLKKDMGKRPAKDNSTLTEPPGDQFARGCTPAAQHHRAEPSQEVNQTVKSIRDAGKAGHLDEAFKALKDFTNQDAIPTILYNCLIQACVDCQSLERAAVVFAKSKSAAKVDVVTYNTMIKGYAGNGDIHNSMRLMKEMEDSGLAPNKVTYHAVLHALSDPRARWSLIDEMQSKNISIDEYTCAILLNGIKNCSQAQQISRVLALFDASGATMDQAMLAGLFEACIQSECLRFFSDRVWLMIKSSQMPVLRVPQYAHFIRVFGQAGDLNMVWAMWRQMEQWDVKQTCLSVGCMVNALVSNYDCNAAWKLVRDISKSPESHESVDDGTIAKLIKGFASSREHEKVLEVAETMKNHSVRFNTITYNTIINSLVHVGRLEEVVNILKDMQNASPPVACDLITYSTIIKGYCHSGQMENALEMWEGVKISGLEADEMMYNIIIDGCAKASMGYQALKCFEEMKTAGVAPTCFTLSILVKVLGRLKRVDEAFDLVASLPTEYGFKANIQVWTCLIQACIVTNNPARALMVHDLIVKDGMQPDARTYTALATGMTHCRKTDWAMNVIRCAYHLPGHSMRMASGSAVGVEWSLIEKLMLQNSPIIQELQMAGVKLEPTSSARFPSRKYEGPRFNKRR